MASRSPPYRRPSASAASASASIASVPSAGTVMAGARQTGTGWSSPTTTLGPCAPSPAVPASSPRSAQPPSNASEQIPTRTRVRGCIASIIANGMVPAPADGLPMTLPDPAPRAIRWIADPAELTAAMAHRPSRIGLDTEFIRERTYWPVLALVQVETGKEILLVDPTEAGIPEALAGILADPGILKVMHSASEDLVAFKCSCGVLPTPLFDTQVAATLAGIGGGMGYQKLVEHVTGVQLAKGETRSDWLRRPLSPAQLD